MITMQRNNTNKEGIGFIYLFLAKFRKQLQAQMQLGKAPKNPILFILTKSCTFQE